MMAFTHAKLSHASDSASCQVLLWKKRSIGNIFFPMYIISVFKGRAKRTLSMFCRAESLHWSQWAREADGWLVRTTQSRLDCVAWILPQYLMARVDTIWCYQTDPGFLFLCRLQEQIVYVSCFSLYPTCLLRGFYVTCVMLKNHLSILI